MSAILLADEEESNGKQGQGKVQAALLLVVETAFLAYLIAAKPFRSSPPPCENLPAAGFNVNFLWIFMVTLQVVAHVLLIVFVPGLTVPGIAKFVDFLFVSGLL
jgi:hypothetical protein